jgi:hypothetical protein
VVKVSFFGTLQSGRKRDAHRGATTHSRGLVEGLGTPINASKSRVSAETYFYHGLLALEADQRTVRALGVVLKTRTCSEDVREVICKGLLKVGSYEALEVLDAVGYRTPRYDELWFPPRVGSKISSEASLMMESCLHIKLNDGYWGPDSHLEGLPNLASYALSIKGLGTGLFNFGGQDYMLLAFNKIPNLNSTGSDRALQLLRRFEAHGWAYDENIALAHLVLSSSPREVVAYCWRGIGGWMFDERTASSVADSTAWRFRHQTESEQGTGEASAI